MECTKCQHWRDWLEKADDPDIWTTHRYMSMPAGDSGKTLIPVLKLTQDGQDNKATTNKEKSIMLTATFFPPNCQMQTNFNLYTPSQSEKWHTPQKSR